jgi:acyl transferase domain-containing protein/acyl carrier protein
MRDAVEIERWLVAHLAEELGVAPETIGLDEPMSSLGLSSAQAVVLSGDLGEWLERALPPTLAYDHPTIRGLAAHLAGIVPGLAGAAGGGDGRAASDATEDIAIIGMGCRFPGGVRDPESFWRLLEEGRDAIGPIPPERWDVDALYDPDAGAAGKMVTRWGGFLSGLEQFDPAFFGVSPREAIKMDPQQRLVLETSWEALEHARLSPTGLMGSDTGVFVGLVDHEYGRLASDDLTALDGYVATGSAGSVVSGRLSYLLGLKGPSLTVDTACSASLVAVHLACQSLRRGECSLALTGGVTVMLTPTIFVEFSRLRGLAPDGRSKAFSAAADGVSWGEGCGLVVLKRLSDAQRDGDRVLALIRGSAVNQDGRSNGLTAPNGPSQQAVIRRALEDARLAPADIDYVECHGTGTALGDPIEVQALGAALAPGRPPERRVVIGSVKTNLGHGQAAAGVAGLMKVVLALQHGCIPRSLHTDPPSPHIAWSELPVKVARDPVAWRRGERARRAGVSSFGLSGTNAHVVVEEAPAEEERGGAAERGWELVVVSGRSEGAANAQAGELAEHVGAHAEQGLGDVAWSLATTRTAMEWRVGVVARTREELKEALEKVSKGETPAGVVRGRAAGGGGKVAFVFPGQGSQWVGMGRRLLEEEPAFREALERCDRAIEAEAGFSVVGELRAKEEESRLGRIDVVQPVLFAVEVALAAMWRAWGIEPDVVVGHSMGEVAAAQVAGALTLEEGAAVICRRSKLLRRISGQGEMALVELGVKEAGEELRGYEDRLSVAVSNSPRFTVLSGEPKALGEVVGRLEGRGVFNRRVKVDVASHSPQVEPLLGELKEELGGLRPQAVKVEMRSTVTGEAVKGEELGAEYWARNVREPVRFGEVVKGLVGEGYGAFVEVSPHPILLPSVEETLGASGGEGVVVGSLRNTQEDRQALLEAVGALWSHGVAVPWARLFPGGGRRVSLPTYAWQRERHWIEEGAGPSPAASRVRHLGAHPLLGEARAVATQPGMSLWESVLDRKRLPWLSDHRVQGTIVLPASAYVEMALAAGAGVHGEAPFQVEELELLHALAVAGDAPVPVQLVGNEEQPARLRLQVASRAGGDAWQVHARTSLRRVEPAQAAPALELQELRGRLATALAGDELYAAMQEAGLGYGPAFRAVAELWKGEGEGLGRVQLPPAAGPAAPYRFHPALLDGCFQVAALVFAASEERATWMPVRIGRLRLHRPPPAELWCHAVAGAREDGEQGRRSVDLRIVDGAGAPVAEVVGLVAQRLAGEAPRREEDGWFLEFDWERTEVPARKQGEGRFVLLGGGRDPAAAAAGAALTAAGHRVVHLPEVPSDPAAIRAALTGAFGGPPPTSVVHLGSLASSAALDEPTVERALVHGCDGALATVQALAAMELRDPPRLWLITRGAQSLRGEDLCVPQAPLLGLGRAIAMEHAELRCTRVDLDGARPDGGAADLVAELLGDEAEDEIAWRGGERYAALLDHRPPDPGPRERVEPPGDRAFRLETDRPGVLEHLTLRTAQRRPPGPREVEIAVEVAGLNFADVMAAMGFAFNVREFPFGGECAGRIVAVGEEVRDLAVGQEVLAFAPYSMASHVTIDRMMVAPRPPGLAPEQAATLPVAFMTAWHSLAHVARLRPGERVLIHSATGGTGQAAMQVARHLGAEILATAGSPEKRAWLRDQGVATVMDSRALEFPAQVLAATGGEGVDVVLNSLSGAAVEASLACLAPQGRFVEIGKRDIYADRPVSLGHFKKAISYSHVDLAGMGMRRPQQLADLLREVLELFREGALHPLPVEVCPASRAADAFRKMAQARHLGKLAVSLRDPDVAVRVPISSGESVRPGSYLVTGGLGGLGLSVARWLSERGAGHLVLMGRSGAASPAQREAVEELSARGTRVTVVQGDVSRRADVDRAFQAADTSGLPLLGVVHAAGILEDATLLKQDPSSLRRVMAPKILGALHLHAQTRHRPLDFFVMYASAAGVLGSPGQANYAAANTFLDALAHHRRAQGLPGLSIDWTAFSEVGLAAAQENRGARIAARGIRNLTPAEGLVVLGRLLEGDRAQVGVIPFELRLWLDFYPAAAASRTLSRLARSAAGAVRGKGDPEALRRLASASPGQRAGLIEELLRKHVAQVLRIPEARVTPREPLSGLGMDSLMGLELRNRIEGSLGISVPATLLWTYPTVAAVSAYLAGALGAPTEAPPAAPAAPAPDLDAEAERTTGSEAARLIDEEFEALQ